MYKKALKSGLTEGLSPSQRESPSFNHEFENTISVLFFSFKMLQLSFLALGTGLVACTAAIEYCPPTGPVLPPPILSDAADFNVTPIHDALRRLVDEAPFNVTDTSFSVTVTTLEETIFQFHHTAEAFSSVGVSEVTGDTIYRIASVSKLFTVLSAMLQEGLDLDDFIWQHVPELEGVKTFEDITLRLLASHISGITRDGISPLCCSSFGDVYQVGC